MAGYLDQATIVPRHAATQNAATAPSKTLFFSFDYPPKHGGIARLCAELVGGLQRAGAEIWVLSEHDPAPRGSNVPPADERRVTKRRPWREFAALRELRASGAGAIICAVWYPEGLLATLAGVRPIVTLAHGLELRPTRQRWRRRAWRSLMRLVLLRSSLIVANSQYTAALIHRSVPGALVTAVPLGVDHRRFCPGDKLAARRRLAVPESKRVIITVSRLVLYKGHRLVFQALASLPDEVRADFRYLIAGQGPDMMLLQQEAEALGLGDVVRWLGYVSEADLPQLYQSADLFVLCTREDPDQPDVEGFGLAFLEAQACGTPVVGTRTGGIPDAVKEGRGGWLIDQDDVAALATVLSRLLASPEEFRQAGLVARERVAHECTSECYISGFIGALARSGIRLT